MLLFSALLSVFLLFFPFCGLVWGWSYYIFSVSPLVLPMMLTAKLVIHIVYINKVSIIYQKYIYIYIYIYMGPFELSLFLLKLKTEIENTVTK